MHISVRPSKCATRVTIIFVDIPSFRSNKAISRIKALIKAARGRSLARVRARQLIALPLFTFSLSIIPFFNLCSWFAAK